MSVPATTFKTISDIINYRSRYDVDSIAFYRLNRTGDRVILDSTMFDIYDRMIRPYVSKYEVSDEERRRYRCRPDLLSLDIYGTPTLMWLILKLNDRESPSRFYLSSTIRVIPPSALQTVFDVLSTKSADRLELNQREYLSMVGEEADGS